jgi:hypothetical protein
VLGDLMGARDGRELPRGRRGPSESHIRSSAAARNTAGLISAHPGSSGMGSARCGRARLAADAPGPGHPADQPPRLTATMVARLQGFRLVGILLPSSFTTGWPT